MLSVEQSNKITHSDIYTISPICLPDQQIIEIRGLKRATILDKLSAGYEDRKLVTEENLTEAAQSTPGSIVQTVSQLRKLIKPLGWNIRQDRLNLEVEKSIQVFSLNSIIPQSTLPSEKFISAMTEEEIVTSRLRVLNYFLNKQDLTVDEIISILGPSKRGTMLSWAQALSSIKSTSRKVFINNRRGVATHVEFDIYDDIKELVAGKNDREILKSFWGGLEMWFHNNHP